MLEPAYRGRPRRGTFASLLALLPSRSTRTVLMVEWGVQMQSMAKTESANRPAKLTVFNTLGYIYKENGIKGLYRGVTPRIGLGIWQTVRRP